MRAVAFRNMGCIDTRFITTFGVSAKEGKNPVGFFGTGMKYAIAICLREGQQITIQTNGKTYSFVKREEVLRGKDFSFIDMLFDDHDGVGVGRIELPFTTELGKTWQLWQAFRELYCNCTDESGEIYETDGDELCGEDETVVVVTGDDFHRCWLDRALYILPDSQVPLHHHELADIHNGSNKAVFLRGIRAQELRDSRSLFTWNIWFKCDLTEDRTIKYEFEPRTAAMQAAVYAPEEILREILLAPQGYWEHELDFSGAVGHPPFLDLVDQLRLRSFGALNKSALRALERHRKRSIDEKDAILLTTVEKTMLDRAMAFLVDTLHCACLDQYRIIVVDLDENTLGLAKGGMIFLNRRCFRMGTKMVASTLYEEYLHVHKGLKDCNREMQNFLMDTIATLGEQLRGEPL